MSSSAPSRLARRRFHFKHHPFAAASLIALASQSVHAQTPAATPSPAAATAAPTVPLPPVLVTGQRGATDRALDDQARADDIRSVARNDGIGRLPDANAAEALQRLPGVSIERDQGEGRYVRVRGLGPDLNAVTINGSLVPSPERDRRAVMLDVLPASLVGSLEVIKTLTPDMDANSLGGTINVKSLSAFDVQGRLFSAELGFGHSRNVGKNSPYGSLVFADRFADGKLGVSFGLNVEGRKFGSDNVETGGAWDGDALEEFERRDYTIKRERIGAALNIEYRPSDDASYYLRSVNSRFSDDEVRQSNSISFEEPQAEGALGTAESERALKARKEIQRIDSFVLGTEQRFGDWKMNLAAGFSRSSEDSPLGISGAKFDGGAFDDVGFTDTRRPRLIGPDAINTAGPYELDEIELERALVQDRERNIRLDLARSMTWFGAPAELKFGGKISRRDKRNEQTTWVLEDFDEAPFSLSEAQLGLGAYAGPAPKYPLGNFGPSINAGGIRSIYAGRDLSGFVDEVESTINNFRMKEDIDAAYVQSTFQLADWRVIAGVRYEGTRFRADGTGIEDGNFVPSSTSRKYRHWLPGLHLRRDLDDDTSLRAAWSNSVVRPTFGQLAPGFAIDGDEAEFGNPDLSPLKSSNLDLGIERRIGLAGVLSAYGFYKNIRDFSYQTDLAGTGRWADFDEAVTFRNGEKASVYGLELAYSQSFRKLLPAPFDALVLGANATFSHSDAKLQQFDADSGTEISRRTQLPSQSSRLFNVMVGYETDRIGVRLAANHKSRYLLEVPSVLDASRDQYVDAQTQLDLSVRFSLSKSLQLSFEALNVNDSNYAVYSGERSRNAQWETYGRSFRVGLKYALN